jgi:hypothetical protein
MPVYGSRGCRNGMTRDGSRWPAVAMSVQLAFAAGAKPARLQNAMADDASKSRAEIAIALRTPLMVPTPVPLATMAPKMATPVAPPTWRAVFSTADAVPAW